MSTLALSGRFRWEIWSKPTGGYAIGSRLIPSQRWLIDSGITYNGIATVGLNDLLDKYFNNGTPPTNWYLGLIDSTSFSALAAADTMSSHAGWIESTAYSESTRPEWTAGSAASGIITNAASVVFTASSDITIQGLFATSVATKGGTTGILWSTAAFSAEKNISSGQQLQLFYELRARQG